MTGFSYWAHFIIIEFIRLFISFVPKKKGLILFSAWFGQKYADNPRYMFEYLLLNHKYCVKWYTLNKCLYHELKEKGIPVVYGGSINGMWQQVRAQVLVSSVQFSDYNHYLLSKCIFIDLDHGFSLKQVGLTIPGTTVFDIKYQMLLRRTNEYWMSAPTQFCMEKISECYRIGSNHIVKCNKPRTDVLFDDSLRNGRNIIIDEIKDGRKAIVWMPTHRSCGEVKMPVSEIFNLPLIEQICDSTNIVFFIKKHYYHKDEIEELDDYPHIYDVTREDVDAQVILSQADALISDYSSSYIEYLILDRPIVLYAYDKDEYLKNERDLYIPLSENTAGELVTDKSELIRSIERISNDWYDSKFSKGRHKARDLYFDANIQGGEYRSQVMGIIDQLMKGTYKPNWN